MRLPIQSSGVSRFTYVSHRARGIAPQERGSIMGTRAQLGSAPQFVELGRAGLRLPPWYGTTTIRCCQFSSYTGRIECVEREVPRFSLLRCECVEGFPPFDFPSIICRELPLLVFN